MKSQFKVVFNFSSERVIKNKSFIISTAISLLLSIIINVAIFANINNVTKMAQLALTFNVIIGIFWISFINISNIVQIIISDGRAGIQSLQNRRGMSNIAIFFAKITPLKIVTWIYIIVLWLFYVIIAVSFPIQMTSFVIGRISVGIFSLFAFDFLITGLTLILACSTKSMVKTLPVVWILTTLFLMFNILGPFVFALSPYDNENHKFDEKYRYLLSHTVGDEEQNFFKDHGLDQKYLFDQLESSLSVDGKTVRNLAGVANQMGFVTYIGDMILDGTFKQRVAEFYNYIDPKTNSHKVTIYEEEELKGMIANNSYYLFLKSVNIESKSNTEKDFQNSFWFKPSDKNFVQLKEVTSRIVEDNKTGLTEKQNELIQTAVDEMFLYNTLPFGTSEYKDWNNRIIESSFTDNYKFWIKDSPYSMGSYLFNQIYYDLVSETYYSYEIPEFVNDKFNFKMKMNYQVNPFMWFYEMVYFSGPEDLNYDTVLVKGSPLEINDFNRMGVDKDGVIHYSSRPFSVIANYLGFIGLGLLFSGIALSIYAKTDDKRKRDN